MPTRWSPTTWRTPRPRWPPPGPHSGTAITARSRPASPPPSWPTSSPTWWAGWRGGESALGCGGRVGPSRRRRSSAAARPRRPRGSGRDRGPPTPGRGLRAGARTFHRFARGQGAPARRAGAPREHRHPRGDHRGARRDGRLRPVGPRGVRRFRFGRRERLPRHGRGDRGASRGSLGAGGSLVTRPEILTRALVTAAPRSRRQRLLPKIATGEIMVAVAVTEPDYGSDVASVVDRRRARSSGGWVINGVKTWCTFAARADVLMLLARTRSGPLPRPPWPLHLRRREAAVTGTGSSSPKVPTTWRSARPTWRRASSRAGRSTRSVTAACTPTSWPSRTGGCPKANLVGGDEGLGKGFYLQMQGFENGRLQTAARAIGVMQAAYEAAPPTPPNRKVFGSPIRDYQLTQAKLGTDGGHHPGQPPDRLWRGRDHGRAARVPSRRRWSRPTCAGPRSG